MNTPERMCECERGWQCDFCRQYCRGYNGNDTPERKTTIVAALREAADSLEGGLGVDGTPSTLYDFRAWLRDRADAISTSTTEGNNS